MGVFDFFDKILNYKQDSLLFYNHEYSLYSLHTVTIFALIKFYLIPVIAGIMFIGFIYLLGKLLNNDRLVMYAKNEVTEYLLITTVIIILIMIADMLFQHMEIVTGEPLILSGWLYLQEMYLFYKSFNYMLLVIFIPLSVIFSVSLAENVFINVGTGSVYSNMFPGIITFFKNSQTSILIGIMLLGAFTYFYEFSTYGVVVYLLPLALILRLFPMTKRIGSTLIGLSLGLLIFVPTTFAIGHYMFKDLAFLHLERSNGVTSLEFNDRFKDAINNYIQTYDYIIFKVKNTVENNKDSGSNPDYGGAIVRILLSFSNPLTFMTTSYSTLRLFLNSISLLYYSVALEVFMGVIYPLFSSVVIVTGVRITTGLLGEELNVSNLTRLI